MSELGNLQQELYAAAERYLEVYLRARDLPETLRLLTSAMSGFGTAVDEVGFDFATSERLYRRDIEQVPSPIEYTITGKHVAPIDRNAGVVALCLNLQLKIMGQLVKLNGLRLSLVFRQSARGWLVEHQHFSQPTTVHGADEAYPLMEIEERTRVLERLVTERTRALNAANAELERRAVTDPLTGLYNRLKIDELLQHELARVQRYGGALSVVLLDIDHFKAVNDNHGHTAGDRVLAKIGETLLSRTRRTDRVGRWGGEEFLIVCPSSSLEEAVRLAEDLCLTIREQDGPAAARVTASFGLAEYAAGESAEELIHRADLALYDAKRAGRNRVRSADHLQQGS